MTFTQEAAKQPARYEGTAAELVASRFRQIHLDFHTSPEIPDVGAEFDADVFGDTLAEARVNWVTLFGKCHHGMSYYPTKAGVVHPSLKFDLLGEQIEACKKRGMATPVYISVRVDQHIGLTRPDLLVRLVDGKLWGPNANEATWYQVCLGNKEYIDYLAAQTEEVLTQYDADGIFYDMCYFPPDPGCFCEKCIARLEKAGHSRFDADAHRAQTFQILRDYTTRLSKLIRDLRPNATIFYNSRVTLDVHREIDVMTHLEIESLTTGGWGYGYFPCWSRLMRSYPYPVQAMTARFHKSWADFGGLKTTPQLQYEAATILSAGAVMNIGDQLHPRGTLDRGAYQVIGGIYREIEAVEQYCCKSEPITDIAVLALPSRDATYNSSAPRVTAAIDGASSVLNALKQQWNGETPDRDNLLNYKVVIIPDQGHISPEVQERLTAFRRQGGAILFSYEAGLDGNRFAVPGSPAEYVEACPWTPSYMALGDLLGKGLPDTEFVNYRASVYAKPANGARALGEIWQPYFNRRPGHFSSHAQTPIDKPTGYSVGILSADGKIGYLAPAIFQGYRDDSFFVYESIVQKMLEQLLPEPLVRPMANVPSAMDLSLLKQPDENRWLLHLVNFQPQRRTAAMEFIERVVTIRDVEVAVRTERSPTSVFLAPSREEIPYVRDGNYIRFVVPSVLTSQIVVLDGLGG